MTGAKFYLDQDLVEPGQGLVSVHAFCNFRQRRTQPLAGLDAHASLVAVKP